MPAEHRLKPYAVRNLERHCNSSGGGSYINCGITSNILAIFHETIGKSALVTLIEGSYGVERTTCAPLTHVTQESDILLQPKFWCLHTGAVIFLYKPDYLLAFEPQWLLSPWYSRGKPHWTKVWFAGIRFTTPPTRYWAYANQEISNHFQHADFRLLV